MPKKKIELQDHRDRRGVVVLIDGVQIAEANYDDHGWSGIDAVERAATGVARAFGIAVDDRRSH